jgi:hypothetical protein
MSVDQELMTCGVLCTEEMCGAVEGKLREGGYGDDNEAEFKPVPSFLGSLCAFKSM